MGDSTRRSRAAALVLVGAGLLAGAPHASAAGAGAARGTPADAVAGAPGAAITSRYSLPTATKTYGGWVADMDGDGDGDLLLNDHGKWGNGSGLYRNDHPDQPPITNIGVLTSGTGSTDRHGCAVGDADRDGRLDIYCTAGAKRGTATKVFPESTNELLLQKTEGTFTNVSQSWGVSEPYGRGRQALFVHADADGWIDLVVTNDPRSDGLPSSTTLYRNDRGTRFVATGPAGLLTDVRPRCLEKADFNDDGLDDIAICTYRKGVRLYQADGRGRYTEVTSRYDPGPMTTKTWGVEFVDVDADGDEDLIRTDTTRVSVRLWDAGSRRFVPRWSVAAIDAQDVAVAPFDRGDRRPDLYVLNRGCDSCSPATNPPDLVYRGQGDGTFAQIATIRNGGGTGDWVTPWDPDGDGFHSWVVGNGHGSRRGPVEVVELTP